MIKSIPNETTYNYLYKTLTIDCSKCCGLCCTALYFSKSDGFPTNKVGGKPCINLMPDFRCTIHSTLIDKKMKGCLAYDCFGTGQFVTQQIFLGKDWKTTPDIAEQMFSVFTIVSQLHQMLWYLVEASSLPLANEMNDNIHKLILENQQLTSSCADDIINFDVNSYRQRVNKVLKKICELLHNGVNPMNHSVSTKDFMGKNFKKSNLDGMDFSMSLLIAADLKGCSLKGTNFLGADLRDTNIQNTDLSESIFLTQRQINAKKWKL